MYKLILCTFCLILREQVAAQIYENHFNFRVEPRERTCFFEIGKIGQMMEAQYQVIDGQHGDLDITFEITDPKNRTILLDYKKSQNSLIMDLEVDGDYKFCLDNSFSMMNSKLVFVYVLVETKVEDSEEAQVSVVDEETEPEEVLEWMGVNDNGEPYYIEVKHIADALTRTLRHIVRARHMLDIYGATKSRDNYLAFKDTIVVDAWSAFQISFMIAVGVLQVYMIKKLFTRSYDGIDDFY